jgi:ATP-dependent Clp protease ATP-binding subunit ClpC
VLQDHLPNLEFKRKVTYMYQALREAYKLSARYVYDTSMPGQAITLLEAAADYAESGLVTAKSVNMAIEKTTGVKTNVVDDDTERDTLLNLETLIHERMIGQEHAVSVVSDALRRARSGVRNQKRPVGTFMFLGPTGVGKTELAKSLAAVYFGGEDKIIRLDMNEFVSPKDVARLIADGTDDSNSLTARVMKQPFSVVLLDEIEKADSAVLTTLLQLLDEGILRDAHNREVSFRDTIVIATSNAGSDRIQEFLHRGYDLQQFEDKFIDELISGNLFHPEFLNRFDEIVVFGPLNKSELLQVVDLILVDVNKNLANQKITVTVAQDAKEYLVEVGYDPRLGARPMRRVVQRAVENTVAKEMLSRQAEAGDTIEITLDQVKAIVQKKEVADEIAGTNK